MPKAIPLSKTRYVQFLIYPPGPGKPRVERGGWTEEFKSPYRYGVGSVVRLGRVGLLLGRWTQKSPDQLSALRSRREQAKASQDGNDGVRLITTEEMGSVRSHTRHGWEPPAWHWRFYVDKALPLAHRWGLVTVDAFASLHAGPRVQHWLVRYHRAKEHGWPLTRSHSAGTGPARFTPEQTIDDWESVPSIPHCGAQCDQVHTMEPPCLWAREYGGIQ